MEDAGANRDEEGRDETVARSGLAEWRGNELATEHSSGGESHVDRLTSDESADGGMSRTEEDAVELKEKDEIRDAREGIVVNLNGTGDQRNLQPSSSGLQSTLKLGDAVEDDARAVAKSLTALLASLKAALSEVTRSSLEHMRSENMAAGQVQDVGKLACGYLHVVFISESVKVTVRALIHLKLTDRNQVPDCSVLEAVDAATKGNRFINSCLRLNEEMKGMNRVATQLESLKQKVDQFEYQSNRYLPRN